MKSNAVVKASWPARANGRGLLRRLRNNDTVALVGIALATAIVLHQLTSAARLPTRFAGWAGDLLAIIAELAVIAMAMLSVISIYTRRSREVDILHSITRAEVDFNAEIDRLTGLLNRTAFLDVLKSSIDAAATAQKGLTLTLVDVRGFSLLNELLGHTVCDTFLVDVASRLRSANRKAICLGRVAGDQFAVLTNENDAPRTEDLGRALSLASPGLEGDGANPAIRSRFRFGVANSKKCLAANFSLLQAAETALGTAKQNGLDVANFDTRMRKVLLERLRTEEDLPRAIDTKEIVPYFQPIISLEDESLIGFEVLARWLHPKRGVIAPAVFIPMLRSTGLLNMMTGQIIHTACAVARYWPPRIKLAFNFNADQLAQPWLSDTVLARIAEGGIEPSRIVIEITEDVISTNDDAVQSTLAAFRRAGCNIALDDFGTGASNIASMRSLEVDYVKIDRSFVTPLPDPRAEQLLSAIVSLAHCLDVQVVAEGIESEAAAATARQLGMSMGQGFAFGRPMDASAVNVFILEVLANKGRVKPIPVEATRAVA